MNNNQNYFELYRRSRLVLYVGIALTDSLDELITSGHINPELAMKVLTQFDKSMMNALSNQVKNKTQMRGHLHTYRLCDEVWTFIVKNPTFKVDQGDLVNANKIKIVACRNNDS
ncbi:transcription initiation factor iia small chain, partial [Wallemia mellicola CBS 633.66]